MDGLTLPFKQALPVGNPTQLNSDGTAFEVILLPPGVPGAPTTAIFGGVAIIPDASGAFALAVGVHGESPTGRGVEGVSEFGVGVYGKGGQFAGQFDGNLQVNGNANVTGDIVLVGAGDCAELFDVQHDGSAEPGTVMVCDENEVLRACDRGYDTKVAGVVSGAGALRPGLILAGYSDGRDSSDKSVPLALVGRAYCKVDAQYAPIQVGDLLTTSPTPGHAMKAADPLKAFGAVIGKALRPIVSGKGLIPILIALQ